MRFEILPGRSIRQVLGLKRLGFYRSYIDPIEPIYAIMEIGTHFGYSAFRMARDYPDCLVMSIDNYSMHDSHEAQAHLEKFAGDFKNLRLIKGDSIEIGKSWRESDLYVDIDVLHIDGCHSDDAVRADFETWVPHVRGGGLIMMHDIVTHPDSVGKFFESLDYQKKTTNGNLGLIYVE